MKVQLPSCAMLCLTLAACTVVLGIEDRPRRPDALEAADATPSDAGAPNVDAGADSDAAADLSPYVRAVLEDTPVIYYRFGEAKGTTAVDQMHHVDADYATAGIKLGQPGALANDSDTSVEFMGGGATVIHVPPSADFVGTVPFSFEFWAKPKDASGALGFILDHQQYPRNGWDVTIDGTGIGLERYVDNTKHEAVGVPGNFIGAWHHVVGTFDGRAQRLFVDGALATTGQVSIPLRAVPGGWTIGGQNCECSSNYFVGQLDELAIYDYALTEARIQLHFQAARP